MKKNSITTITEVAKRSLLRLCSRELEKRKDNGYIDVDVEYIEREEKRSSVNWENWVAGFIASAITMAVLSYSFIILKIVWFLTKNS
jgi:hypothetical protein